MLRVVPGRLAALSTTVLTAAQLDSVTDLPNIRCEVNTSSLLSQLQGMCPPVSSGTFESLATCFLKSHHLLTWSGVIYTIDSETLSLQYWASHTNNVKDGGKHQQKQGGIKFLSLNRHLIHTGDCLRRRCCWPSVVKTLMVLNRKTDHQKGGTRMDAQPCSWPLPHQATRILCISTLIHLLCSSFKRYSLSVLAFNTHEQKQKYSGLPLSSWRSLCRVDDPLPNQGFR